MISQLNTRSLHLLAPGPGSFRCCRREGKAVEPTAGKLPPVRICLARSGKSRPCLYLGAASPGCRGAALRPRRSALSLPFLGGEATRPGRPGAMADQPVPPDSGASDELLELDGLLDGGLCSGRVLLRATSFLPLRAGALQLHTGG